MVGSTGQNIFKFCMQQIAEKCSFYCVGMGTVNLVKTMESNRYYVTYGSTTTVIANQFFLDQYTYPQSHSTLPRAESHSQFPLPFVHWSYRKKTTLAMHQKC